MIAYDKHQCTNHFLCIEEIKCKKLITTVVVFYISLWCAIMSEITLNISLHGSNSNRLLRNLLHMINVKCTNHTFAKKLNARH